MSPAARPGVAVGPLIGALIFTTLGVHGTLLMLIPGLLQRDLAAACGATGPGRRARLAGGRADRPPGTGAAAAAAGGDRGDDVPQLDVVGLEAYIPSWYKSLGYGPAFYGPLATTVVLASAVGTIGSGSLADRFGRRAVIVCTLVLSIPSCCCSPSTPARSPS